MIKDNAQIGEPSVVYKASVANILDIDNPVEGMEAESLDTHQRYYYDGTDWCIITSLSSISGKAGEYVKVNASEDGFDTGTPTGDTGGGGWAYPADGRLSLESGVPVSTTDQTAKTRLYYTQYRGNQLGLYSGSSWETITFTESYIDFPSTTNTNYDVFAYNDSSTVTLELTAWTNNTTRATELTRQDGVLVKTGAVTRRYLGTVRTTGTSGQCEDSDAKRFVWNNYNQILKRSHKTDGTVHNYNSTWRYWNNNSANFAPVLVGQPTWVRIGVAGYFESLNAGGVSVGIDGTTVDWSVIGEVWTSGSLPWTHRHSSGTRMFSPGYYSVFMLESGASNPKFTNCYVMLLYMM